MKRNKTLLLNSIALVSSSGQLFKEKIFILKTIQKFYRFTLFELF